MSTLTCVLPCVNLSLVEIIFTSMWKLHSDTIKDEIQRPLQYRNTSHVLFSHDKLCSVLNLNLHDLISQYFMCSLGTWYHGAKTLYIHIHKLFIIGSTHDKTLALLWYHKQLYDFYFGITKEHNQCVIIFIPWLCALFHSPSWKHPFITKVFI